MRVWGSARINMQHVSAQEHRDGLLASVSEMLEAAFGKGRLGTGESSLTAHKYDAGAKIWAAAALALPADLAVHTIDLSFCDLIASSATAIAPVLERPFAGGGIKTIHLGLGHESQGTDAMPILMRRLPSTLKCLSIGEYWPSEADAAALAARLPVLHKLKHLTLQKSWNGDFPCVGKNSTHSGAPIIDESLLETIGDPAIVALAPSLAAAPALQSLVVSGIGCGDAGVRAIAAVLPQCAALRDLDLSHNEVGGVASIGDAALQELRAAWVDRDLGSDRDADRLLCARLGDSSDEDALW